MFKLDLEKAEEPEIKLPTSTGSSKSLHGKQMGKQWELCQTLFLGAPKSMPMAIAAMKLKDAYSLEEKL